MRYLLVVYDLPTALHGRNPTPQLRRIGVRINLSCWILPAALAPYDLFNQLRQIGGRVETLTFDSSEEPKIRELAHAFFATEADRICGYVEASAAVCDHKIAQAMHRRSLDALRRAVKYRGTTLSRACREFEDICAACAAFGIEAEQVFGHLRTVIHDHGVSAATVADAARAALDAQEENDDAS